MKMNAVGWYVDEIELNKVFREKRMLRKKMVPGIVRYQVAIRPRIFNFIPLPCADTVS